MKLLVTKTKEELLEIFKIEAVKVGLDPEKENVKALLEAMAEAEANKTLFFDNVNINHPTLEELEAKFNYTHVDTGDIDESGKPILKEIK